MMEPTYRITLPEGVSVLVGVEALRERIGPDRFDAAARDAALDAVARCVEALDASEAGV